MEKRPLSSLFARSRSAPPLVSEDDIRAMIEHGAAPVRQRAPLLLYLNPISLSGVIMTALVAIIIGIFFIGGPDHARVATTASDSIPSQRQRSLNDTTQSSDAFTRALSLDSENNRDANRGASEAPGARSIGKATVSPRVSAGISGDEYSRVSDRTVPPFLSLTSPLSLAIESTASASTNGSQRLREVPLAEPMSEVKQPALLSLFTGPDSISIGKDSVWNYGGFMLNYMYTSRSFGSLNSHLAASGFPSIGSNGGFGGGLSLELPPPHGDSSSWFAFPVILFPSRKNYAPGISVEWLTKPEIVSANGSTRVAFSSWTGLLDSYYYLPYRHSRLALVLSVGATMTSLSVAKVQAFDDVLKAADAAPISMSQLSGVLRAALRFDYVIIPVDMQMGITAGYTWSLGSGSWRMASSLEQGIGTLAAPDDSPGGWHLAFHFTFRGSSSREKTK